jgi:AAA+ ATPase superfamily predicted ATPase
MIYSNKEKKELVIKLSKEQKTYPEIAKMVKISPRDIKKILDEYNGEGPNVQKSNTAKAFELLLQGESLTQVVIKLDLDYDEAKHIYLQFLDSQNLNKVKFIYKHYEAYLPMLFQLVEAVKNGRISVQEFEVICNNIEDFPSFERFIGERKHHVNMRILNQLDYE